MAKKGTAEQQEAAESQEKSTNQVLIDQIMVNVGKLSTVIENESQSIFGQANLLSKEEINDFSQEFMELFVMVLQSGSGVDRRSAEYKGLREFFISFSHQIQSRGGTPDEFVRYVQFLQRVFIDTLEEDASVSFKQMRAVLALLSSVFNDILLDVFHVYLEEKERTIQAQQEELRETSTPITEIWDGVLTLPIIGSMDSTRTMNVMENLLAKIEAQRARVVVIDVTGVQAIDSQVSHHLVQMIRAIGLMGSEAILTGMRPEIARSLTNLNIDLGDVVTRATMADGLKEAFRRMSIEVVSTQRGSR